MPVQPQLNRVRNLSNVTVFVKSFLRLGLLRDCLEGVQQTLPETKILVIDDSSEQQKHVEASFVDPNYTQVFMPFDSGFGAKSNEMIRHLDTEYVLIGSDDFNFGDPAVRGGIEKLHTVLEKDLTLVMASGRVNRNPYEFVLQIDEINHTCVEKPGCYGIREVDGIPYQWTDLTVNYSLIRRKVFERVHWDSDVKIGGGEHGAFFIDIARAFGHGRVAYVPGVNINELPYDPRKVDPRYAAFRQRASQPGRICLKRRGIDRYCCGGTTWETA